eukprot:UN09253
MEILQGVVYMEPGYGADGGEGVVVTGEVNSDVPGTYTLTYTATDAAGNAGTATREVIVIESDQTWTYHQSVLNTGNRCPPGREYITTKET